VGADASEEHRCAILVNVMVFVVSNPDSVLTAACERCGLKAYCDSRLKVIMNCTRCHTYKYELEAVNRLFRIDEIVT
jgi:hypothetical protein